MVIAARSYHEEVSYRRGGLSGAGLDWENQPEVFKRYEGLEHIPLPREAGLPAASLPGVAQSPSGAALPGMAALSAVLFHAAGLTRSTEHNGRRFFYRACPSAGALYPCEMYLAWPGTSELSPGLYHFDVLRHALVRLRQGFVPPEPLGMPGPALPGEALLFVSAIFFRSAWKYKARAYRYLNLDVGHIVEGLSLGLGAYGTACTVEPDFDDAAVARFLGLDPQREACLCTMRLAVAGQQTPPSAGPLPEGVYAAGRCAAYESIPGEIASVHEACSGIRAPVAVMPAASEFAWAAGLSWETPPRGEMLKQRNLFESMSLRRSRRAYQRGALPVGVLQGFLDILAAPLSCGRAHPGENACLTGIVAARETGLAPGLFFLDPERGRVAQWRGGEMLEPLAGVCLDQLWMREAFLHVLFLADMEALEASLGDRGYRECMQAAGRLGHRVYLAAESLGYGACGIGAFYDHEARGLLGLPPEMALLYAVAVGVPHSKAK